MQIRELIEQAGGVDAIVAAAALTSRPVTTFGVLAWRTRKVGENYWQLIIDCCAARGHVVTPNDIFAANRLSEKREPRDKRPNRRRRYEGARGNPVF